MRVLDSHVVAIIKIALLVNMFSVDTLSPNHIYLRYNWWCSDDN